MINLKKILILLYFLILISSPCYADLVNPLNVRESDGSPDTYPYQIKVPNGTLTDGLDGTITLNYAGSPSGGVFTAGSIPFGDGTASLAQNNANFFWDNINNRLGIGTTGPLYPLNITDSGETDGGTTQFSIGSSTSWGLKMGYAAGGNTVAYLANAFNNDSARLDFRVKGNTNVTTRMAILGNGNVGIGTTSPNALLHVAGTTAIFGAGESGTPTATTIRGAAASGTNIAGANLTLDASNGTGTGGSGALVFRTAPTGSTGTVANTLAEAMRITNAGNVGIGTTNPVLKLDVRSSVAASSTAQNTFAFFGSNDSSGPLGITINHSFAGSRYHAGLVGTRYGVSGNDIDINVDNGSGGMTVQYQGNVGIGTASPAALLHVAGTTTIFGVGEAGTPTATTIRGAAASGTNIAGTNLTFDASNGTGTGGSGALVFRTAAAGATGSTANTLAEAMRITNAGFVGIGTTGPSYLLNINDSGETDGGTTQFSIGSSTSWGLKMGYAAGGNTVAYLANAFNNDSARLDFRVKGNTNVTTRMAILGNGNVGIGTTAPQEPLHIKKAAVGGALRLENSSETGNVYLDYYDVSGVRIGYFGFTINSDTRFSVWNQSNGFMQFGTNNTERIRILSTGEVGIGTSSPGAQLHAVAGAAATKGLIVQGATLQSANLQEWQNSSGTVLDGIYADGAIEVGATGTTPGKFRLSKKGGTATATTDWALTGGWGANATISAVSGNDSRGTVTVTTSALDSPLLNPTITLTFKDGTFTTAPFAVACMDNNSTTTLLRAASTNTTATTLAIVYDGTPAPTTSATYRFSYFVEG